MLRIDHVVRAVADLEAADERWRAMGIATVPGGIHPRWGTGNRIAPLGDARYVELLAVLDPVRAAGSALGSAVEARARGGDSWFALCLADDDLNATAARLGLEVRAGDRTLPDGSSIAWRSAGMEDPTRTPDLPFFIEWDVAPGAHPGDAPIAHPSGASDVAWIEIAGDPARFAAWTANADLPVRFVDGAEGIVGVALATPGGELVVR